MLTTGKTQKGSLPFASIIIIVPILLCTVNAHAQGYDDIFTEGVNEGAINW
jgi:hypothetical protein